MSDTHVRPFLTKVKVPGDRYRYIGTDPFLAGKTAIGWNVDGVFKVRVLEAGHPWDMGWHEHPREMWALEPEFAEYRCVNPDSDLHGHSAIGRYIDNLFHVQLNDPAHPYSHGWYSTPRHEWMEV